MPGGNNFRTTREYEELWRDHDICYLSKSTVRYVVYIDGEEDIDWATSDPYDAVERESAAFDDVQAQQVLRTIQSPTFAGSGRFDEPVTLVDPRYTQRQSGATCALRGHLIAGGEHGASAESLRHRSDGSPIWVEILR
jgi:hypothetical protein